MPIEPEIIVDHHPLFGREDFWLMDISESQPAEIYPNEVSKEFTLATSSGAESLLRDEVSELCESGVNNKSDGLQQEIREMIGSVGGVRSIQGDGVLNQDKVNEEVLHLVNPDERLKIGSSKIVSNQQRLHNSEKNSKSVDDRVRRQNNKPAFR